MKEQPTKAQIEKFVKYVKQMAFFFAIKRHEEPLDEDLVVVMKWLDSFS